MGLLTRITGATLSPEYVDKINQVDTLSKDIGNNTTQLAKNVSEVGTLKEVVISIKKFEHLKVLVSSEYDWKPCFDAAIAELKAGRGGKISVPAGVFPLASTVQVDADSITVVGAGQKSTYFRPPIGNVAVYDMFLLGNTTGTKRYASGISDCNILNSTGNGISIINMLQWTLDRVEVAKAKNHGVYGKEAWIGRLINSHIYDNEVNGFHPDTGCHSIVFTGSYFISNGNYGMLAPSMSTISGVTFEHNAVDIYISSTKKSVNIQGNYVEAGNTSGLNEKFVVVDGAKHITISTNGSLAKPYGIILQNSASFINIQNNDPSYKTASLAYNDQCILYIDGTCKNITVDNQSGTVSIHPDSVREVNFLSSKEGTEILQEDSLLDKVTNGLVDNWEKIGTATAELVPSISKETKNAVKVTTATANDRFRKVLTGYKPDTIYTVGALISSEGLTNSVEFRFFDDVGNRLVSGEEYFWGIQRYTKGSLLVTSQFRSRTDGTIVVGFGSPYLGSFLIEWISLVEGAFNQVNFPRGSKRKIGSYLYSPDGSQWKQTIDNTGAVTYVKI
ncbi:right-handed parallel beta-helix repeat-containing protein [Priestia endophytica]